MSVCFVIQFVGLYGIIFYDDTCNNDVDIVTDDTACKAYYWSISRTTHFKNFLSSLRVY